MNRITRLLLARRLPLFVFSLLLPALAAAQSQHNSATDTGWPTYGNDPGGTRYSPAKQIDRNNVSQLKVAWTFRTGALPHDEELDHKAAFEATPILVDGKLYLSTPYDHVIALDPVAGEKLWEYDPKLELPYGASEVTSRGVAAWRSTPAKTSGPCALRIFIGTLDARLVALDGATGKPCADFGTNGEVDLTNWSEAARSRRLSGHFRAIRLQGLGDHGIVDWRQPRRDPGARHRPRV